MRDLCLVVDNDGRHVDGKQAVAIGKGCHAVREETYAQDQDRIEGIARKIHFCKDQLCSVTHGNSDKEAHDYLDDQDSQTGPDHRSGS